MEDLDPNLIGDLLGLVAHDLRNPLSALHSNVSFLDSILDNADQDSREALADAIVSCDGLLHIIDNLDLLAYVLRGRQPVPSGPVALAPLVTEVLARAAGAATSHGVELAADPGLQSLGTQVLAHRDMLARSLANLVHNAIQHGGTAPVRVSASEQDGRAYVRIVDGGTPLAEALRASSFSAVGQLSSKGVGGGRYGRGIGLFSAKVAADAAGASVAWFEPDSGGNGFELSLDIA